MDKPISTFLYYFLISLITSFFSSQKHFICALKKIVHNSVVPADGAHTKVEFLNTCIKCFGKKDVMNEIKKYKKVRMVLPISMSVYEIQCGSLVHFCMVNSVIKKVDTIVFSIWGVLRLAHGF